MSMFKKMKERITDEVNSATNKLQNMQLIDNLALTLGQTGRNDHPTSVPSNNQHQATSSNMTNVIQPPFSLLDDNLMDDEELNSELSSPQQLFNESAIPRKLHSQIKNGLCEQNSDCTVNKASTKPSKFIEQDLSHLDLSGSLNSDIDSEGSGDELTNDTSLDGVSTEIDLTSDNNNGLSSNSFNKYPKLERYRLKYKNLVNLNRQLINDRAELNRVISDNHSTSLEKTIELKNKIKELKVQLQLVQAPQDTRLETASQTSPNIDATKSLLQNLSAQHDLRDPAAAILNNAQYEKSTNKIRDLEGLLSKCKESLKAKNNRIEQLEQNLKDSDRMKELNENLKSDLAKLKQQHEDWTVSVAESKRSVHEELETRTSQLNKVKNDHKDLSRRLQDVLSSSKQQSARISELEGQIVRMSAAHEQERISLRKELEKDKNQALNQLNQEHERNITTMRQELQGTIESLKGDIMRKDEELQKFTSRFEILEAGNRTTVKEHLEKLHDTHSRYEKELSELREHLETCRNKQIIDTQEKFNSKCVELEKVSEDLKAAESKNQMLSDKLKLIDGADKTQSDCESCPQLKLDIQRQAELSQQEIYELNSRLSLLSAAIEDQEKEIKQLRSERDSAINANEELKLKFEELAKKNESLSRVIHDTETDMQSQQEQLDELILRKQELESLKKSHSNFNKELEKLNSILNDRNIQIQTLREGKEAIQVDFKSVKYENENLVKLYDSLRIEKDELARNIENLLKEFSYHNQIMISGIHKTMRNLETPGVSPSSEDANADCSSYGQLSSIEDLPKSNILMEQLSSLAIDRCNAYVTASQSLEASLIENKALVLETERLKEELDRLNSERKEYLASSTEETEQLREDNQLLANECQSSNEKIEKYKEEITKLKSKSQSYKDSEYKFKDTVSCFENAVASLKENQSQTEQKMQEYLNQISLLEGFEDSHITQPEEISTEKLEHFELIRELEKKIKDLATDYEVKCQSLSHRIKEYEVNIAKLKIIDTEGASNDSTKQANIGSEKFEDMEHKLSELQLDILDKTEAFDAEKKYFIDTIDGLKQELTTERNRTMSNDHNYQIGALQRVIQQYQEENQRLKELSRVATQQASASMPDPTEYEYLKNIVLQFMLGKEPLVLAKVISAVFRFNPDQIDQVVKTQESLQFVLNSNRGGGVVERRK